MRLAAGSAKNTLPSLSPAGAGDGAVGFAHLLPGFVGGDDGVDFAARIPARLADVGGFASDDWFRVTAPQPAQGLGHDGGALFHVVALFADHEFGVVARGLEGLEHHLVVDGPASGVKGAVGFGGNDVIVLAVLQEDADGFGLGLADEGGQAVGALHGDEGADEAEDAVKLVGTVPGGHEGADGSGADAGDCVVVGVLREVVLFGDLGNQFLQQEARITVAEGIVFEDALEAVLRGVVDGGQHAGIDEDADQRRQVSTGDEVVEDHGDARAVVERSAAIQEDHEGRRLGGVVLGRNVNGVIVRRAGIELAGFELEAGDGALRNAVLRLGIGPEGVVLRGQQRGCIEDDVERRSSFPGSIPEMRWR